MKKILPVIFLSFTLLFLVSGVVKAAGPGCDANGNDPAATGLVPCGVSCTTSNGTVIPCGSCIAKDNTTIVHPTASGTCPLGTNPVNTLACPCTLGSFFVMLLRIYNFVLLFLVFPIAGIMIVLGGVMLLVSGGNPGTAGTAKKILLYTFIGIAIIFCSWLIINGVMAALGYTGTWSSF